MKRALVLSLLLLAPVAAQTPAPDYDLMCVQRHEKGAGIYRSRGDGSNSVLVADTQGAIISPGAWSPDGARVAVFTWGRATMTSSSAAAARCTCRST